jgi:hypothetical protein
MTTPNAMESKPLSPSAQRTFVTSLLVASRTS